MKNTHPARRLIVASAALAISITSGHAEGAAGLPGGANSLRENYQDWQVACAIQDKVKHCALGQTQVRKDGGRVLSIDLAPAADDSLSGTLVLPFGLLLASGVEAQVDDKPVGDPLPFHTCLPAGCVVPLTLDAATVKTLLAGTTLKLATVRSDDNQPFTLSVSLSGFAPALDRVRALLD